MIAGLIVYGLAVALLVGLAAWGIERVAARRGAARRGLWFGALMVSLAMPVLRVATASRQSPTPMVVRMPTLQVQLPSNPSVERANRSLPDSRAGITALGTLHWPNVVVSDRLLESCWAALSLGIVLFYGLLWLRLKIASRHWRPERVDGEDVWFQLGLDPPWSAW